MLVWLSAAIAGEALGELRLGRFDCDIPIQPGIVGAVHLLARCERPAATPGWAFPTGASAIAAVCFRDPYARSGRQSSHHPDPARSCQPENDGALSTGRNTVGDAGLRAKYDVMANSAGRISNRVACGTTVPNRVHAAGDDSGEAGQAAASVAIVPTGTDGTSMSS